RILSSSLDRREVLSQVVAQTARVCRVPIVSVFYINDENTHLELVECFGGSEQYRAQQPVRISDSWFGQVIAEGKAVIAEDVQTESKRLKIVLDPLIVSVLAVPLISKGKP